ncbi:MAG: dTDP-glucose 4,6-dehydratase [Nitrosomonadaceae bacterium]|nr:dTDP-glucose 4,6-dehydratase [Nitrosomonadaceae bacterium]
MMQRILITGGFGYLGGRIAAGVVRDGWQVRLASRQKYAPPAWLPDAETTLLDVLQPNTFDAALSGVQAVVHLAALNEIESSANPKAAVRVNTLGSLHLLEAAIRAGIERFIFFSTAHIYGAPLVGHITECSLPRPVHPYAITHRAAEDFVLAAHNKNAITGIVVRLSNGFGVPMHPEVDRWTLLVNDLCLQAVQNKKLTLRSRGLQQRDFIALHDVGRAVSHFLNLPRSGCGDGLFNLGGECAMTVCGMAQRIARCCRETLGYLPEIVRPDPEFQEGTVALQYDISKLKHSGFSINGNIDGEITRTLEMCAAMQLDRKV